MIHQVSDSGCKHPCLPEPAPAIIIVEPLTLTTPSCCEGLRSFKYKYCSRHNAKLSHTIFSSLLNEIKDRHLNIQREIYFMRSRLNLSYGKLSGWTIYLIK